MREIIEGARVLEKGASILDQPPFDALMKWLGEELPEAFFKAEKGASFAEDGAMLIYQTVKRFNQETGKIELPLQGYLSFRELVGRELALKINTDHHGMVPRLLGEITEYVEQYPLAADYLYHQWVIGNQYSVQGKPLKHILGLGVRGFGQYQQDRIRAEGGRLLWGIHEEFPDDSAAVEATQDIRGRNPRVQIYRLKKSEAL